MMGTLEEVKGRRGRSRTPRSGTSTVTSKSSVEKNTDNFVIDGVPNAYDYDSIVSEDEWLDEKSKGSRYMVKGQKQQDQANRTKSLMSDDDDDEDGDDQLETKSIDKYSHSNKDLDKIPTIDRLWSRSLDSDTMQFQAPATTTTYKHSYFGALTGSNKVATVVSTAANNKRSNTKKDVDSNPSMMEPIYEMPKNRKKNKNPIVPQDNNNSKKESMKTKDENKKPLKSKPSTTSKVKVTKTKPEPKVAKPTDAKKKPTDEISTEVDGSTTSSLTDPLEHMLLNSKNDSNKAVQDIEQKLDLLRAMAAEVDEKQRVLKEKQHKLLKKKKSKNKSGRSTSRSRSKSRSKSGSRSRSKCRSRSRSKSSRSRSRSKSRSRTENTKDTKERTSGSKSKHRSHSKSMSSSTNKSSGTNHSKTPSLPVTQSEGVFSNAATEPHRNHTPKNKKVDGEIKSTVRNPATKSKRTSLEKNSIVSSKNSTSDKMSRTSRKSENGNPSIDKRRSRSRSSKRSTSRSSSKDRRKSSSKSGREHRSSSRSHSRPRKSTTGTSSSSKRDSVSRPRSSREKSRSRSRSEKSRSRSRSQSRRSRSHARDATTASRRSRSRSVPSTRDSQSRSRKSRTSTGTSKSKSNKEKGNKLIELNSIGNKKRTSSRKFNKYLLDSDLKEESVERARYELTKEMIALLEKSKLDELRNKKMYPSVKGTTTQRKKRKDILTNFANFFRKSKHDEEVIVSNPASAESTNDENDSYYDLSNDENIPKPPHSTERRQSLISLKPKERVTSKSSRISESGKKTILHDKGNIESKASSVTAEKSKKAIDLKKVAVKRAAARKLAATESQLPVVVPEKERQPGKEETNIATIEEKLPSVSADTELEQSVEEKEDGKSTAIATSTEAPKTDAEVTADSTERAVKKTGMMRRFVAKKKNKGKGLLPSKKESQTVSFTESKDTHDIVEATRSVIDVVEPSVIKIEQISIPQRVTNIMQDSTGATRRTLEPSDNRSKSTNSVVTKVPEYLVAKSNPLEIDEYSINKEISNEPGMVQCLRFYSCGRTADVLNVAIQVSDNCNGDQYNKNSTSLSKKVKRRKSQIDNSFPGDAILQSRSMMTEVSYTTRKTPEVHMPTVEVILEEESNPQVAETKLLERREDVENMESIFASMTESDDDEDDESLEEAPDLRMPRVHSFIMDVSKMTLHLDEDPQERLTKDAIRRGVASAEEISITSIQVPTQQQQQEQQRDDCVTSNDGIDDDADDDCTTESGILDDGTNSDNSYDADNRSKRSKGRVQKIFSRFRTFRANKKLYSM